MKTDPSTSMESKNPRQLHYPLLDAIRFAAAVGVVWIHVESHSWLIWTREFGRFAVPFFACSAVYLAFGSLQRHPQTSMGSYALSRFKRIYLLFLVWSAIYWIVRSASSLFLEHTGFFKTSLIDFFWNGEAIQLWFLPFIFLATIGAFYVAKAVQLAPASRWFFLFIFAAAAVGLAFMPTPELVLHAGYTAGFGYEILPCCCAALALGLAEILVLPRGKKGASGVDSTMLGLGISLFLLWLVMAAAFKRSIALENVAGFGLILVSLSWKTYKPHPWILNLGAASFGIYLIHPLFVEGMQHILPKVGFKANSSTLEVAIFLTSLVASYLCVEALRISRFTRWLTG